MTNERRLKFREWETDAGKMISKPGLAKFLQEKYAEACVAFVESADGYTEGYYKGRLEALKELKDMLRPERGNATDTQEALEIEQD